MRKAPLILILMMSSAGSLFAGISKIDAASAQAASVNFGVTATAGDLILACGHRDGSATAPTNPAGYTIIDGTGANTNSMRIAYKIAAGGETSVSMTNATSMGEIMYRGFNSGANKIGAFVANGSTGATLTFSTLTLKNKTATSWLAACGGSRNATNVNSQTLAGMTQRTAVADFAMFDTNAGVSTWSSTNMSATNGSTGWRTYVVEILGACPDFTCADTFLAADSGNVGDTVTGANMDSGSRGITGWDVSTATSAFITIDGHKIARKCSVTVTGTGTSYPTSTNSQSVKYDNTGVNVKVVELNFDRLTHAATMAGLWIDNINGGASGHELYDLFQIQDVGGHNTTMQLDLNTGGVYRVNVESNPGFVTTHSSYTTITAPTTPITYWVSLATNTLTGTCHLYMYNAATWANVVDISCTSDSGGQTIGNMNFGNQETGARGWSNFENILEDWTLAVSPLGPGTCSASSQVPVPLSILPSPWADTLLRMGITIFPGSAMHMSSATTLLNGTSQVAMYFMAMVAMFSVIAANIEAMKKLVRSNVDAVKKLIFCLVPKPKRKQFLLTEGNVKPIPHAWQTPDTVKVRKNKTDNEGRE